MQSGLKPQSYVSELKVLTFRCLESRERMTLPSDKPNEVPTKGVDMSTETLCIKASKTLVDASLSRLVFRMVSHRQTLCSLIDMFILELQPFKRLIPHRS